MEKLDRKTTRILGKRRESKSVLDKLDEIVDWINNVEAAAESAKPSIREALGL